MTEKTWLTYAEAAEALGLSVEGIRQRARREHWRKMLGNTGKALVMLPEDAKALPGGDAVGNRVSSKLVTPQTPVVQPAGEVERLQARVAELRADLDRERAEVSRERSERLQERERADRLTNESAEHNRRLANLLDEIRELSVIRERLSASELRSTKTQERHAAELRAVQARLEGEADRVREEFAAYQARPWWRRLAG